MRKSRTFPSTGSAWQYSGEGYYLLQKSIESESGTEFDAFMHERADAARTDADGDIDDADTDDEDRDRSA